MNRKTWEKWNPLIQFAGALALALCGIFIVTMQSSKCMSDNEFIVADLGIVFLAGCLIGNLREK
jgi:hypothetical protein